MKNLKTLLLVVLVSTLFSCSPEENDSCNCIKTTYTFSEPSVWFDSNGLPHLSVPYEIPLSTEDVLCQDETDVSIGNDIYFKIECN